MQLTIPKKEKKPKRIHFNTPQLDANTFTQENIDQIRTAFEKYAVNGTVSLFKLLFIFNELGQHVTESQLKKLAEDVKSETVSASPSVMPSHRSNVSRFDLFGEEIINTGRDSVVMEGEDEDLQEPFQEEAIPFRYFLKMVEKHRKTVKEHDTDQDILDAFLAMGGHPDKTGFLDRTKLRKLVEQFDLGISIEDLLQTMNSSTRVNFEDFKQAMKDLSV